MSQITHLQQQIEQKFQEYSQELFKDLGALVAINSERGITAPDAPFGEGPKKVLLAALDIGSRLGFKIDNVDNYAGIIEMGKGEESVGVVAHLDIVPAGNGWTVDPFTLTEKKGRLYGRGTEDDKGPAIGALYGMRILRDLGLPMKRRIQLLLGCNEEQGSDCMIYHNLHRPIPTMGFTPDGSYPLIYGEKGNYWGRLIFPPLKTPLRSLSGGSAVNAIPGECVAVLDGKTYSAGWIKTMLRSEDTQGFPAAVSQNERGDIILKVYGSAGHGSEPETGVNAIVSAARILRQLNGLETDPLLQFVAEEIGRETNGARLGIAFEDEISSPLSLNLGTVICNSEKREIGIDIRFPVSGTVAKMDVMIQDMARRYGIVFAPDYRMEPHYVSPDSPLVRKLLNVYREATGEVEAQAFTIGGGTYAKDMGANFVAFGPTFPDSEPSNCHSANEHIVIEQFLRHCVICALAMYELATM